MHVYFYKKGWLGHLLYNQIVKCEDAISTELGSIRHARGGCMVVGGFKHLHHGDQGSEHVMRSIFLMNGK